MLRIGLLIVGIMASFSGLCMAQTETESLTLTYDGLVRTYELFVPETFNRDEPASLLMVLHGGGDTAQGMISLGFNTMMDDTNGIVVYPNGLEKRWNDGRIRNDGREKIDDAGFLAVLIDTLADAYNVPSSKAYVTGFSNGAGMTFRLACDYPEHVAGIATVASLYAATLDCTTDQPVAVMSVGGDEDPLIPLEGGDMFYGDLHIGTVLSLDATLDLWRTTNGCADDSAESVSILNAEPDDEKKIIRHQYQDVSRPSCFTSSRAVVIPGLARTPIVRWTSLDTPATIWKRQRKSSRFLSPTGWVVRNPRTHHPNDVGLNN